MLRPTYSVIVAVVLALFLSLPNSTYASKKSNKFETPVRIAFVPQRAFMVDNGVVSGSLAPLMECTMSYFAKVEFVEMSNYDMLLRSLEGNVVDIGINVVRSGARDQVAMYAMDLYQSRILLVNDESSSNNQGAGVLAVRQGSDIAYLMEAKGYNVNTQAYSVGRLIEMYRQNLVNSFAESELAVFDEMKAMDVDGVDYDYTVLADIAGGAYLSRPFNVKNPGLIESWKKVAQGCAYLSPKIDS